MGQKIHPTGFRLAVNRGWNSRWFANNRTFAAMLNEDLRVRDYLRKRLSHASVAKIVVERPAKDARITIHSARPGAVIGKKGEDIEIIKGDLRRLLGVQAVHVNIEEVKKPEVDAQLIADSIAQQLEKRIMFRRAMKRAMQNAMRAGAQGVKIMSAGRLNGIDIARTEWYREGRVPLHTLRADIDYGFAEAKTTYGVIGIKVWVYKGDVLGRGEQPVPAPIMAAEEEVPARRTLRGVRPPRPEGGDARPETAAPAAPGSDKPKPPRGRVRRTAAEAKGDTSTAKPEGEVKPKAPAPAPAAPPVRRVVKKSVKGDDDKGA
jgi:small subunit ribosomal protein S3